MDSYNPTLRERAHFVILGKPDVICDRGEKKTFNIKTAKYGFCGNTGSCKCLVEYQKSIYKPRDMSGAMEKRKTTWLAKYGVDNASKSDQVKQKRLDTMSKRNYTKIYDTLAHNKETRGYNQVLDRVSSEVSPMFTREEYMGSSRLNVYNWKCNSCESTIQSHIDYGTIPRCIKCNPKSISIGESEIKDFIMNLGFKVELNNKKLIAPLELDIFIPEKNIAIEYNGVYWHSVKYKSKSYHVDKYIKSKEKGIHLIQIFEDEWITKRNIVENRLRNILGLDQKLYARKGRIEKITSKQYKAFTEAHHLRGYAHSTIKYGLIFGDEIAAVMGFSKSRYTKSGFELVRYCSNGTVVGGAGKLFKHFIKHNDSDSIVTYADRSWSNGDLYRKLGLEDATQNQYNTGYWYIKNNIRYHRSNFTKSRLVKLGYPNDKTEFEIMESLGYLRINDCGNYKFTWKKKGEKQSHPPFPLRPPEQFR